MRQKTIAKLGGFVVAAAATATLVGFAANGTGAYFTDSHTGTIKASTGDVKVTVSPSDGELDFDNLLPGVDQTDQVTYTAGGTGPEDIWLVFPQDGTAEAFEGTAGDGVGGGSGGGLGRFGHFELSSTQGASFDSYNLNNAGTGSHSGDTCPTDPSTGWGGSSTQPATPTDTTVAFCAPPPAMLLASNLTSGQGGTAYLTFGFTKLWTDGASDVNEDAPLATLVDYSVVATQHGISPSDAFNG
jgi:hypothetical protein